MCVWGGGLGPLGALSMALLSYLFSRRCPCACALSKLSSFMEYYLGQRVYRTSPITMAPDEVRGFEPEKRGPLSFFAVDGLCPV